MHEIQKHILKILSENSLARYADLKPKHVDGNLFTYHLKKLIKEGFISSKNGQYKLTLSGKRLVDKFSFKTLTERIQPKIVTILVIEKKKKFIFYKRKRTPFKDLVGLPYGKIHLEERLLEAAQRELLEKTGLSAKLSHQGDIYLTVHDETELVSHMLCHVFYGKNPTGILTSDSSAGECFWADPAILPQKDLMPGVPQILRLLKSSKSHFFEEYFLNTNET